MANIIYLDLKGARQGAISAGCSTSDSIGNRFQIGHEDQIQVLSMSHLITREKNVAHHPFVFSKPIDKASPLMGVAATNNESLTAEFSVYRVNQSGSIELFYVVKLKDATIVDLSCVFPNSVENNKSMPHETVMLKYKSISWEHKIAGTSGYSIWDEVVY